MTPLKVPAISPRIACSPLGGRGCTSLSTLHSGEKLDSTVIKPHSHNHGLQDRGDLRKTGSA
jgi:hypothetical protein